MLHQVPGAYIELAAGPGGPAIVRLRGGEEVFTQVLADGVKINDNGGFFDMQGITLGTVDRVEVARGPQSALYGSSAMSGVVQLLSSAGVAGSPSLGGLFEGGGATMHGGNYRGALNLAGGGSRFVYSASGEYAYDRGIYSVPHDLRSRNGVARLDAMTGSHSTVTGIVRYIGMESNLPVRDAGATRIPLDPDAQETRDRWITSLQATIDRGQTSHRIRGSQFNRDFVFDDRKNGIAPEGQYSFFVFDATFRLHSLLKRTTLDYVGTSRLGSIGLLNSVSLSYGGVWERESLHDRTSGEFGDGDQRFARNSGALYAELQAEAWSRVAILAGVRGEKFERLAAQIDPRASVVVTIVPGRLALRSALGRAYKAPDLQVVYANNPFIVSNPGLAPETSTSWEVGADASTSDRMLSGSLVHFRQRYDNLIRNVPFEGTDRSINRNLGRSTAQGIEGSISVRPRAGWEGGAQGARTSTEIVENSGLSPSEYPLGGALPFRPRYTGTAFIKAPVGTRFSLVARAEAVGRQTVLTERFSGQRIALAGYTTGSLIAEARIAPRMTSYARIDNLLDRRILTAFDRLSSRRSVTFGLAWRGERFAADR